MLKLLAMNLYDIEQNSRLESLVEFKHVYGDAVRALRNLVAGSKPQWDEARMDRFVFSFMPLLHGVYPYVFHSKKQLAAMKEDIRAKREIITALAFYISKRVELNFAKLKMNRVAISLYDVVKTTGEVKDVFRFTYEGRDYICLSRSEKIRAGLEVAELIKRLLGVQYPTFIDDVESVPIIDNVRPTGQVFIAKVVKGAALQVQVADTDSPAKAA